MRRSLLPMEAARTSDAIGRADVLATSKRQALDRLAALVSARAAGPLIALVLLSAVFGLWSPHFFTLAVFKDDSLVTAEYGIIAIGVTLLMIAGEFDLTVGVMFALTPMVMASLYVDVHWPIWAAFVVAMLVTGVIGAINGVLVTVSRLPSFIVTLGMLFFWQGLLIGTTSGGYPLSIPGTLPTLLNVMGSQVGPAPIYAPVLWFVVLLAAAWYVLGFTGWGNWIFASGADPAAARAMGVPVRMVKFVGFVVSALLAGLTGCLILGYQMSVSPTQGQDYELYAIVAAVVGGTSLFGGRGTVLAALIGAAIIAVAETGLVMVGAPSEWYTAVVGLILIAAVLLDLRVDKVRAKLLLLSKAR